MGNNQAQNSGENRAQNMAENQAEKIERKIVAKNFCAGTAIPYTTNGHSRTVHKYSSHENSSEIDHEKQNKSHVQKKRTATETRPSFSPLI